MTTGKIAALVFAFASSLGVAAETGLDARGWLRPVVAPAASGFACAKLESGVQFRVNGVTKNVIFYGPSTVRVNANFGQSHWDYPSIAVIGKPAAGLALAFSENDRELVVAGDQLRVVVNKRTGALAFHAADGRLYTREREESPEKITGKVISGAPTYEVENTFTLKPGEAIYGFGYSGPTDLNRRGKDILLVQTNVGIVIPMMLSTERYGILWDTCSAMKFRDDASGATLWAESAPGGVDYYFMGGDTLDNVIQCYRKLTGDAPMYPKQAFGLFMSKERYPSQKRILEVAETFRKEQFPLDYIVQDWQYWGSDKDGTWSGMIWDPGRFPDPAGMTKAIHDLNLKLMVSIWPSVGNDTPLARELDVGGLRFEPLHWISRQARIYDAFSPKGREIYFKHVKSGLLDKGVDALWMDGTEVEVGTACWNPREVERDIKSLGKNALGDFSRYLNAYTLMTTLGAYEGQRASGDKRVFTLTRSAWAGAQRTAAASWSGDIFASWRTLQEQIPGGLNVMMAGNPYWTQDTGGFFVTGFPGGEKNPAYRELYARWMQYAVFNPIMRIHGTSIEREPYLFKTLDPEVYHSMLKAVNLRYRLLPYIYSLSWQVTRDGYTMMRSIPMDFTDDRKTYDINDSFLFGPSFLVHPVTRPMYHVENPPADTIPSSALRTADGKPGLDVQYFAGENFEEPKARSVDLTVDKTWPGPPLAGPPGGLSGFDHFSVRWQGFLIAPESGEYEIGAEGDDGFRVFLDGEKIVEDWALGPKRHRGVRRTLKAGGRIALKIEYFQGTLDRSMRVTWRTPADLRALADKKAGADTAMHTYLPAGASWYDFWTDERFPGGATVKKDAPLDTFPLYVRAGAIIPVGPLQQWATEKPGAPYEIRVYPGADGKFTIYEDDNETYRYEKGEYATCELVWDDAARTLAIGARQGSFPGLVARRQLDITVIGLGQPKRVVYEGKPVQVDF